MADHYTQAPVDSIQDVAAHEKTYRGFLRLLEIGAALSVVTLLLLYYFLAR